MTQTDFSRYSASGRYRVCIIITFCISVFVISQVDCPKLLSAWIYPYNVHFKDFPHVNHESDVYSYFCKFIQMTFRTSKTHTSKNHHPLNINSPSNPHDPQEIALIIQVIPIILIIPKSKKIIHNPHNTLTILIYINWQSYEWISIRDQNIRKS